MANKTSTDREVRTNSEQHKGFRGDKHGNLNSNGKNAVRKRRSYNKFERKAKKEHEAIIEHKYAERVIKWDQLPAWMKDNIYILSGYRAPTGSYKKCIASLLYLHNEFVNVWTHFLGFLGFIVLMFTTAIWGFPKLETVTWSDVVVTYIFLVGAAGCLLLSSTYHLFSCHSHGVSKALNKCDYIGITLLITGSFVPVSFYAFYCHEIYKIIYIGIISVLGIIVGYCSISPKFALPEWRVFRATTYVAMGVFGVVPTVHSLWEFGYTHSIQSLQLECLLKMAFFYISGAAIYGSRIPERWFPGKFDIWMHSHSIFHCFVLVAVGYHYIGVLKALNWTHSVVANTCPV